MIASLLVAAACFTPPVDVPIAIGFARPECDYCPGHRGVEYHPPVAVAVHAVVGGVVSFAGRVAGTLYVVVAQGDGSRATYGMLLTRSVGMGDRVAAGQVVGYSSARLYFGLRDPEGQPIDPTGLLGHWVGRPRLIPVDGTPTRAGPPPTLTCPAAQDDE
ncbi:MAG: M23 family metallopeptidase [Actinomycetia bacterium]|nr:M23 family metallopeptidase [Actinomycetes bacterium]